MTGLSADLANALLDFIDQGGPVLWLIFFACVAMWAMILERLWFIRASWPRRARRIVKQWRARGDRRSWRSRQIRAALVSESHIALHAVLPLIRAIVALCPLLGLLGTVVGMIGVFEVIAISGNDDAQAMARGVYRATIPTMAGLVVALSGIYFTVRLDRLADRQSGYLADRLASRGEPTGRDEVQP